MDGNRLDQHRSDFQVNNFPFGGKDSRSKYPVSDVADDNERNFQAAATLKKRMINLLKTTFTTIGSAIGRGSLRNSSSLESLQTTKVTGGALKTPQMAKKRNDKGNGRINGASVSWYGRLLIIATLLVGAGWELFRWLLLIITRD